MNNANDEVVLTRKVKLQIINMFMLNIYVLYKISLITYIKENI